MYLLDPKTMRVRLRKDAEQFSLFGGDPTPVGLTPKGQRAKKQRERWGTQTELFPSNQFSVPTLKPKPPKAAKQPLKPKAPKAPNAALKPKPKEGDTRINRAGNPEVFKNKRWRRVSKDAPVTPGLAVLRDEPAAVIDLNESRVGSGARVIQSNGGVADVSGKTPAEIERLMNAPVPAPAVDPKPTPASTPEPEPKLQPRVTTLRGMSKDEFAEFKQMAAIAIPFAKIQQNKQQYAQGNVNIKAPASQGYQFTPEQHRQIVDFAENVGLMSRGATWDQFRNNSALGAQGYSYLWLPGDAPRLNAKEWQAANPDMTGAVPSKADQKANEQAAADWMRSSADEKMSAFNLANKFRIPKAAAARILKKLEAEGAVEVDSRGGYTNSPYYRRVPGGAPAAEPAGAPKPTLQPKGKATIPDGLPSWVQNHPSFEVIQGALASGQPIATGAYVGQAMVKKLNPPSKRYPSGSASLVSVESDDRQGMTDTLDLADLSNRIQEIQKKGGVLRESPPINDPKPTTAPAEPPAPTLETDADFASTKRQEERIAINQQVRDLLTQKPDGPYTQDEMTLLAKYSGKGGITQDEGSLSEYYTRPDVAKFTTDLLYQNGYKGGVVLEPSCGNGVFLHQLKGDSNTLAVGVELDSTSGKAAEALNPHADVNHGMPFERFLLDNPNFTPDAIVGNVPFGTRTVEDLEAFRKVGKGWKDNGDFFVHESLSRLKPGGTMALIVPHGITTGKNHAKLRRELMKQGRVVGAYRLPNTAFAHTGTQTITDILVIQKHPDPVLNAIAQKDKGVIASTRDDAFIHGKYFEENPDNILGTMRATTNQYGGESFTVDGSVEDALAKAPPLAPKVSYDGLNLPTQDEDGPQQGDEKYIGGRLYRFEGHPGRWHLVEPGDGVEAEEGADPSAYGTGSVAEAEAMLQDPGQRVMIDPENLRAFALLAGATLGRDEAAAVKEASMAVDQMGSTVDKAKLAHAMLLAGHLQRLQKMGTDDPIHLEQALAMLQAYREAHGNPATDRSLSALAKQLPTLLHLQGAFDEEGTVSDYFANHDAVMEQAKRSHSEAGAAMGEAFRAAGGEGVTLGEIRQHLDGTMTDDDLAAALAADPTVGYMGGGYMPLERLLVGNGFNLIDAMLMEAETLPEGSPLRRKLEEQVGMVRARLQPRAMEDITTPFWAVGSWIPVDALNAFLEASDYRLRVEYNALASEWRAVGEGGWGIGQDILTTMNRGRISHGVNTKEAKEAIAALEQQFGQWLSGSDYRLQVEEAYNVAFNGDLPQEFSGEPLEIKLFDQHDGDLEKGIRKKRLHDYQTSTIRQMAEQGRGIVALGVGLGKAQPLDAKILTPNGWKRMGDMQIGDEVINSQGGVSRVTGVFPQGDKEIFEVIMSDGSSTECCDDHLWAVQTGNDRIRRDADVYRVMPLKDFRDNLRTPAGKLRYFIPIVKPIQFKEQDLPLDPYLMGIILGDGSTRSGSLDIATGDDEIVDAITSLLPLGVDITHCKKANYRVSVKNANRKTGGNAPGSNPVINALRALDLWGCRGENKFIPDIYKFASIEQRLALLQGLMDADGTAFLNKTSSYVAFSSTSKKLADDVRFIVESFGGKAPVFTCQPSYTYKGEKRQGRESYQLNISLPAGFVPFRLTRKINRFAERTKFFPSRTIFDVQFVGIKPAQCISVDAADNLYVTDDCIVTHNTSSAIGLALHLKEIGRAKKPAIVVPKSVLANWVREIDFWAPEANVMILGQTQQFWANGEPAWEVPGHKVKTKGGNPVVDANGNYLLTNDAGDVVAMSPGEVKQKSSFSFKDDDRATKERKMRQVSQNAYDLVLMSAPVFQDIALHPDTEQVYLDDIAQAGSHINSEAKSTHKDLERIEKRRAAIAARTGDKTENTTFEELGLDCLIHDEAHSLKNLFGTQRSGDIAFLSQAQSNRSLDFYYKARHIREQNNNQNVYLLTATPTTNNPLEAFNMLQHVCPEEFEARGIQNIDDFLGMFGKIETVTVPGVDLEMTEKNGLVGFKNLRDLRHLFNKYTRMQSAKDVGLPIPEELTQDHYVDMTDAQKEVYADLKVRAQKVQEDENDHIFSIISDMDKAAIDLGYYNQAGSGRSQLGQMAEGEKSPKIEECANQVMSSRAGNGGKQIVFCDAVQLHEDLKRQLVEAGYPEDEIAIVNAGTVPKSSDRQKISQAYNSGRISLVIGNTATMGEGMNFQIGTTDIHHLTTPWTPAAIEQRNGRGVRQGNELDGVNCHYYHAKGSFDGYRKGVVERKRGWIDDLWRGDADEATNQNTGALSMDDIELMMADDPEEARARLEANKEVQMARHSAKMTGQALKQFGQLQTMKLALSKMAPDQRNSERGRALEGRLRATAEALGRNQYFPHKDLLDGSAPAYVGTDGTVLRVGDHVQKSDGSVFRIQAIDPSSGKMETVNVSGSDSSPNTLEKNPRSIKFDSINRKGWEGVKPITFDTAAHAERVISKLSTYSEVARLDPDTINANRDRLLDRLKDGGYSRVPYLDPKTNLVEEARITQVPEGAQILWPHDGEALEHCLRTMGDPAKEGQEWRYHDIAASLMGQGSWYGVAAELKPRIEAYREQHKAMAEQGPKEGDTRINDAGNQEVFRNSRWHTVGEDAPAPDAQASAESTSSRPEALSFDGAVEYLQKLFPTLRVVLREGKAGIGRPAENTIAVFDDAKQDAALAFFRRYPTVSEDRIASAVSDLIPKIEAWGYTAQYAPAPTTVSNPAPETTGAASRVPESVIDGVMSGELMDGLSPTAQRKVRERVVDAIEELGHAGNRDKNHAKVKVEVKRTLKTAITVGQASHQIDPEAIAEAIATAVVDSLDAPTLPLEAVPSSAPAAPVADPAQAIVDGMMALYRADDDGATERNDTGFNGFHTPYKYDGGVKQVKNEFVANMIERIEAGQTLTPNQLAACAKILTVYRKQLEKQHGVVLPTTEAIKAHVGGGDSAYEFKMSMKLVGNEIHIVSPTKPSKADVDKLRAIPGRDWKKELNANVIPVSSFKDALDQFPAGDMDIDPAIFEHPGIHEDPKRETSGAGTVRLRNGEYHVSFPYDRSMVARVKSITRRGNQLGKFREENGEKFWRFPGDDQTLAQIMNEFPEFDLKKSARHYTLAGVAYELRRVANRVFLKKVAHAI